MAAPQCMSNDGNQAVFIGTFMANGDSVALCENCLPAFTASVTADMFGVDGQQLLTWLQTNAGEDPPGDEQTAAELAAPPAMLPEQPAAGDQDQAGGQPTGGDGTDPTSGAGDTQVSSAGTQTGADPSDGASTSEESPPDADKAQAEAA